MLPVAAVAGCGVAKNLTIRQEFSNAESNLDNSTSASFTLRSADPKGTVAAALKDSGNGPSAALLHELFGASITYTLDPASDKTLRSVRTRDTSAVLTADLSKVTMDVTVRDASTIVADLRLVGGVLYARADLAEIAQLAKDGGDSTFPSQFQHLLASTPPALRPALTDAQAGKWLKLPLAPYFSIFQKLAAALPMPGTADKTALNDKKIGKDLFAAIRPYIKVTDAHDSASDRILDVNVQVRPALEAALDALEGEQSLPFAAMLKRLTPGQISDTLTGKLPRAPSPSRAGT